MLIKKGIPVSPGIAIGPAIVIDAEDRAIPRRVIEEGKVEEEKKRLSGALTQSCDEIERIKKQAAASVGAEHAKIFAFHLGMLQDQHLQTQINQLIEAEHVSAEYAVFVVMRQLAKVFRGQSNRYFRERVSDIWDLERRIMGHLIGQVRADLEHLTSEATVIAHDLTPSQTASLDREKVLALATDAGGSTSHTAILAHALGIPAIVGLEDITGEVSSGDTVIIDGNRGVVIVDPNAAKLLEYRQEQRRMAKLESALDQVAHLPGQTKDGTPISMMANIEFPSEIEAALAKGAEGIGLYRTEFVFLGSKVAPTENDQYEVYTKAIEALNGRPLTIRTLDLGADKIAHVDIDEASERNPFLGCRSIRLCLQNLPLFKTQLRAILRASIAGPVRIMFPLISNMMEIRQARMILTDVMEDLDEQGVAYSENIPVGMMVEVPSAALQAAALSREVDFFSIGTNDLIQYTVAVDRSNERIASLYSGAHPAVIQLVRNVIRAADRAKIEVSLCGEMGGQPEFAILLIGLGLRSLSITPPAIPEIKQVLMRVSVDQCKRVAKKAGTFETDREVLNYLRTELRKVVPQAIGGPGMEY